ncbi:hypothetical protein TNIN_119911 [Trichonephila inaurata madagascariensis]|uniref:Uncharacterized protein n=1 Tax=Trichonephila inaurata madagascariensis TaxID=2747483 RepID=A0A8X6WXK7_9ARAC|nr:hypothetical protein TNIN_119911 [Trichonephila inaurata madagascariensis]
MHRTQESVGDRQGSPSPGDYVIRASPTHASTAIDRFTQPLRLQQVGVGLNFTLLWTTEYYSSSRSPSMIWT